LAHSREEEWPSSGRVKELKGSFSRA
jgi:hypothetical protein